MHLTKAWAYHYALSIKTYTLIGAFLLSAASCSTHDDFADCAPEAGGETVGAEGDAYITVSLSMARRYGGATRVTPVGGEDGNGKETGQDYENDIESVRIYFFAHNDKGVNGDAGTPVAAVADFDNLTVDGTRYITGTKAVRMWSGDYDVVAVANVTQDEFDAAGISTLGTLRDYVQKRAWTDDGNGKYSRFVMASADEADVVRVVLNTVDNPLPINIDVERHAARVDYKVLGSYDCQDPGGHDGKVEIVGAGLLNNVTAGSYMLKRVADEINFPMTYPVTYLGKERMTASDMNENYVIDPWTLSKLKTASLENVYGVHYTESSNAGFWRDYIKEGAEIATKPGWLRAAYTMENTTAATETSQLHNTGMVFKAIFHPAQSVVKTYGNATYTDGSTFFVWGTQIFADLESLVEEYWNDKGTTLTLDGVNRAIESMASVAELTDYATNTLPEGEPVGYRDYLLTLAATDNWKAEASWTYFVENELGYTRRTDDSNNDVVTVSEEDGHHTRQLLDEKGVRVYKDAVCFYMWWIRHCDDGNSKENSKMEYAIVRNNIYELDVTAVAGLGSPIIPVEENIMIKVNVRDWVMLDEEKMEM